MKNIKILLAFGAGVFTMALLSMSYSESYKKVHKNVDHRMVYMIPVKPLSTVIVHSAEAMNKFIKKGYQLQQVTDDEKWVMVKY